MANQPAARAHHNVLFCCRSWKMSCGYGPYVDLMQQYPLVTDAFLRIKPMYQKVTSTISLLWPTRFPRGFLEPSCRPCLVAACNEMLHVRFEQVIADITRRMGEGMAEFIEKEVLAVKEYDLYCHYVAGLVGIGLSQVQPPLQHGITSRQCCQCACMSCRHAALELANRKQLPGRSRA